MKLAGGEAAHAALQVVGAEAGEEAEVPEVDAEDRDRAAGEEARRAQQRAVAAQAEHRVELGVGGERRGPGEPREQRRVGG